MAIVKSDYERITARCPAGHLNVYSRISDLRRTDPIDGMNAPPCYQCGGVYWMNGDSIDPAFRMLLLDCADLRAEKRYMYCILNICQAYEMFFGLYFRSLLYRAFAKEKKKDMDRLNVLLIGLHERMSDFMFASLRCNFLRSAIAVVNAPPKSLDEAEAELLKLNSRDWDASKVELGVCSDAKLREKLTIIQSTKIHRLRNDVVHERAYRPTVEQVDAELDQAQKVLFVVPRRLGVWDDDLNVYLLDLV